LPDSGGTIDIEPGESALQNETVFEQAVSAQPGTRKEAVFKQEAEETSDSAVDPARRSLLAQLISSAAGLPVNWAVLYLSSV
jgi:hypothetical protein